MTIFRPNNDSPDRHSNPNRRILLPIVNPSEAPTSRNVMTPVGPGESSTELIRQHLYRTPHDSLFIFEESPVRLNRPDDIPYLAKEVEDLEGFLNNSANGSTALRRIVAKFLQFRREELSTARRKEKDITDTLPPPTRSPALPPHGPVRKWLRNLFP